MGDSIYSDDGNCYQIDTFKKRQRGCYSMQNMATLALNGAKRMWTYFLWLLFKPSITSLVISTEGSV